jgi:hypothetical protein
MRTAVFVIAILISVAAGLSPEKLAAQSACSAMKRASDFANCVDDVANFQCRNSSSFEALRICFAKTARGIIGNRTAELEKWNDGPLNLDCEKWFLPGLVACSVHGLSGAPEEWCFRNDVDTVSWCEGDPPNHKCRKVSCPLSSCNTSSVLARCGMVWRQNFK